MSVRTNMQHTKETDPGRATTCKRKTYFKRAETTPWKFHLLKRAGTTPRPFHPFKKGWDDPQVTHTHTQTIRPSL